MEPWLKWPNEDEIEKQIELYRDLAFGFFSTKCFVAQSILDPTTSDNTESKAGNELLSTNKTKQIEIAPPSGILSLSLPPSLTPYLLSVLLALVAVIHRPMVRRQSGRRASSSSSSGSASVERPPSLRGSLVEHDDDDSWDGQIHPPGSRGLDEASSGPACAAGPGEIGRQASQCGAKSTKMCIVAPNALMQTAQQPDLVQLPHPQSGSPASFVMNATNTQLCEVIAWREDHRAWFVDQEVESNGSLYLVSPFDPLFIILSYLKRAEKLQPLDHVVRDPAFPHLRRILSPHLLRHMNQIARPKGSSDLNVWQYDSALTLAYLSRKVQRLSIALQKANINVSGSAQSEKFVQSNRQTVDEVMYLRYAFQTLSMYLDEELGNQLRTHLGIPDTPKKRASTADLSSEAKKQKNPSSREGPIEDYSKGYKQTVIKAEPRSARQKALARSATGSKNIMAFFQKK